MPVTLLTPDSKESLRKTIRALRPRLLEQLYEAASVFLSVRRGNGPVRWANQAYRRSSKPGECAARRWNHEVRVQFIAPGRKRARSAKALTNGALSVSCREVPSRRSSALATRSFSALATRDRALLRP
jgi:hypothetical protein